MSLRLEDIPEGALVLDGRGRILEVNTAFAELIGAKPSAVRGPVARYFAGCSPADCPSGEHHLDFEHLLKRGGGRAECRLQGGGGDTLALELSVGALASAGPARWLMLVYDVRARKEIEARLREGQERLAEAQRLVNLGNWTWDIRSNALSWSDEIYRIFGMPPGSFTATYAAFLDRVHPEDRSLVEQAVRDAIEQRSNYWIEHRILRPDGSARVVEERGRVFIEDGEPVMMLGTVQDVTDRRRIEDTLARQAAILDQVGDSVVSTDLEGFVNSWNKGAERLFGYAADEAMGRHISFIYPPEEHDHLREQVIRPLREKGSLAVEVRLCRKNGRQFPAWLSLSIQRGVRGEPVGMIGVSTDISERKARQEQTRKLSQALEQTADLIMITDRRGVIEYVNPAFEAVTGYQRAEIIGREAGFNGSGRHSREVFTDLWNTIASGKTYHGVLINRRKDGELYWEEKTISPLLDEAGIITSFVSSGQDISARIRDQERLEYLAHYDALTSLPNRALLRERLTRALTRAHRNQTKVALLFVDLDRFKMINDNLGHSQGDEALKIVADRLRGSVRASDTIARISGDEFAVVLEGIGTSEAAETTAEKILQHLSGPVVLLGHEFHVTASIGISCFPADGRDVETLLRHADTAMYRAKEQGRNAYRSFTVEMSNLAFERLTLETSLRQALVDGGFRPHFQPKVRVADEVIVGVEALLRWDHPEYSMVSPSDFVPVLEETGLILPFGEWMLRTAFSQVQAWRRAGVGCLRLHVNLSGRQLHQPGFAAKAIAIAAESGFDLSNAEFEIAEGVLMEKEEISLHNLRALRDVGVRFAIDDFGTGYSSLGYLRRFPIDTLKIDRSFIQVLGTNEEDDTLVRTILAMARSLGIDVVAEGVETPDQLAFLRSENCAFAQGYLFGRPMPAGEILALLDRRGACGGAVAAG